MIESPQGGAIGIQAGKCQTEAEMGLKETLADLTEAGEKERQRREDAPQKLLAWLKEINDLYAWVKDSLSEHASLRYEAKPIQLREDQLGGRYEANTLLISAGNEERPVVVALEPVASLSMGATGVIEMYRVDRQKPFFLEQVWRPLTVAHAALSLNSGRRCTSRLSVRSAPRLEPVRPSPRNRCAPAFLSRDCIRYGTRVRAAA